MFVTYRANTPTLRAAVPGRTCLTLLLALTTWLLVAIAGVPARADDQPSAEAKTVARELVEAVRFTDQFKALMPSLMATLKPSIVQGRADVARDYDAMAPMLIKGFEARLGELVAIVTEIYALTFTIDEMRGIIAFYRSPAGSKLLDKSPALTKATMAAGQQFGRSVGEELQKKMIEELRKKGHNI